MPGLPISDIWLFCSAALIGLALGSFISAVSYRMPRQMPWSIARSHCPSCHATLTAADLLPVLSWLYQKGKCRHCHAPIHWRYPLIELCMAGLTVWLTFLLGVGLPLLWLIGLTTALLAMLIADIETGLLPDPLQALAALCGIGWALTVSPLPVWLHLQTAIIAGGGAWLLKILYRTIRRKEGLGMGDVKLMAVAGLWLSPEAIPGFLLFSGVLGIIIGVAWQWRYAESRFPFGPALIIALMTLLILPFYGISPYLHLWLV